MHKLRLIFYVPTIEKNEFLSCVEDRREAFGFVWNGLFYKRLQFQKTKQFIIDSFSSGYVAVMNLLTC